MKNIKNPKTTVLAGINILFLIIGAVLLYLEKIDVTGFTLFIGTASSVIASLIGLYTKDADEKD
jgi:hypothetical protein